MRLKFTDSALKALKATGHRYEVWDASHPAFGVRVGRSGKKAFVFMYHWEGRPRRMTLGQYPRMALVDAGVALAQARRELEHGTDPGASEVEKRRQTRAMPTVRELGEEYLEKHCKPNKKSWRSDERTLNHDVFPVWGSRKISSIKRSNVNDLLDDIAARAPVQSNRAFAVIRSMFRFAESRDYIEISPCYGVKKHTRERSRDRVLEMPEVAAVLKGIKNAGITETLRLAFRFLLLTGQRIGEVVNAEWAEIDLENAMWTLPGSKVKNGKPHRVPLSPQAMGILRQAKGITEDIEKRRQYPRPRDAAKWADGNTQVRWVFASRYGDKPITTRSIDRAMRRLRLDGHLPDFRPHDLRRTAASHMTRLGIDRLTVHKLLNHSDRSVTAIYDRYDYDTQKRQAVNVWGAEVEAVAVAAPPLIHDFRTPGKSISSGGVANRQAA